MKFFYCAAEPGGEPLLVIRPHLEADIKALRAQGGRRASTHGDVRSTGGHLIFEVEPSFEQMLRRDLRAFFSRKVSALQSARVVVRAGSALTSAHAAGGEGQRALDRVA